jgi:molybdate transport system substrate-binding protein
MTERFDASHAVKTIDGNQRRADMTIQWSIAARAGFVAAAMAVGLITAQAAEVKVLAANPAKGPMLELVSAFEKTSGHKVITVWGGTEAIAKRVSDGEVVDIVIIAASNIDKLIAEGKLVAGGRADFAKSGVGIAVRTGLPKPDISSGDAVKRAVLAAQSVAYSSGPSGFYIADMFTKMGISDQIKGKVTQPASGVQVGELLARGEADLGFQQVSELVHVKGIDYLGPLPADIQNITVYSAGLHTAAPAPDAAKALMKFLTAPEAAAAIRKTGMEPG